MTYTPLRLESEIRLLSLTGRKYDITDQNDRKRSNDDLIRLFHDIQDVIKPQCVLEIGAREATFSRETRHRHPDCLIYAFEASSHAFERMSRNYDFEALNIRYLNLAVTDATGTAEFQIQKIVDGALVSPLRGNNSLLRRREDNISYEPLPVASTTLDDFHAAEGLRGRSISAWIDVEGASELVLKGASHALQDVQSLFIEMEDAEFWVSQWRSGQVLDFLMAHGLYPVARDFEYDLQHNAIFLREPVLANGIIRYKLASYYHL
ncbi:FkbM family methyltransferase [Azospirillum largimobile]